MGCPEPVRIGDATLYHGDAYALLRPIVQDLTYGETAIVTDPPYEFSTSGGGIFRKNRSCMDQIQENGLDKGFDIGLFGSGVGEGNVVIAPSCVVFCHNDQLPTLLPALRERWRRVTLCVWRKLNPMPVANKAYAPDLEFYAHCWNEGAHPVGTLAEKRRSFEGPVGRNEFGHPTQKPLDLMRKIIRNVSAPIIIDPFMGTGTTGIAALEAGKRFIGIEMNADYFAIAQKRLRQWVNWRSVDGTVKAPGADEPEYIGTQEGML